MRFTLFLLGVCGAAQCASGSSCDDASDNSCNDADVSSLLQGQSVVRKSSIAVTKKEDGVTVHIGRSRRSNERCVNVGQPVTCASNAGDLGHRLNRRRASDTFEITTNGNSVCARRTDEDRGWGMALEIQCTAVQTSVEVVEVDIGRSRWSHNKCVMASVPVRCEENAGNLEYRLNTDHRDARDEFHITTSGRQVCAERLDKQRGWGMRLRIGCEATGEPEAPPPTPPPTPPPPPPPPPPPTVTTVITDDGSDDYYYSDAVETVVTTVITDGSDDYYYSDASDTDDYYY